MTDSKHLKGKVTAFDAQSGMAKVEMRSGKSANLHAGAFISGRPARLPTVGEKVQVQLAGDVVLVARPVEAKRGKS